MRKQRWNLKLLNGLRAARTTLHDRTSLCLNRRTQRPRRPQHANASYAFFGKDEKRLGVTT
jgi:hypothetical protein